MKTASETPTEMVLESLCKSKLLKSIQLQIVLTLQNIFEKTKSSAEEQSVTKNQKKKTKASAEKTMGECYQWQAIGRCSKWDSCSFRWDPASGSRCAVRQEEQSSFPALKAKEQTDGKIPPKRSSSRREGASGTRGRIPCRNSLRRKCTYPSCKLGAPPACLYSKSESTMHICWKLMLIPTRWDWWTIQQKVEEKWCEKISCFFNESFQLGCVSQDSYRRKAALRKIGKLTSCCTVTFSNGTWHHIKIWERKGPSRSVIQKCGPHERRPCDPKCEEKTQHETLHQEQHARGVACDLAKSVFQLKKKDKSYVLLTFRSLDISGTTSLAITSVVGFLNFRRVSCSHELESCLLSMCIDVRILTPPAFSKMVPALVGRRTWPCPSLWASRQFSPSPTLLCGRIVLDAKFLEVSYP